MNHDSGLEVRRLLAEERVFFSFIAMAVAVPPRFTLGIFSPIKSFRVSHRAGQTAPSMLFGFGSGSLTGRKKKSSFRGQEVNTARHKCNNFRSDDAPERDCWASRYLSRGLPPHTRAVLQWGSLDSV